MRPTTLNLASIFRSFSIALGIVILCANSGVAGAWTEVGDAGDLPGTGQVTMGTGSLDSLSGSIDNSSYEDIDLFRIRISNPTIFSATLFSDPLTGVLDTYLFIFDSNGRAVVADNDATFLPGPGDPLSQIPAGTLAASSAGDYFIAVSTGFASGIPIDGDLPQDAAFNLLFDPFDLFLDFGPGTVAPISINPIASWQYDFIDFDQGDYEIQLTGAEFARSAVVPEPLSSAIWASGLLSCGLLRMRRRRRS